MFTASQADTLAACAERESDWLAGLDDLDLLVCTLPGGAETPILAYQVEFYARHNPGCEFRPITEAEKADYERFIRNYAKRARDEARKWGQL